MLVMRARRALTAAATSAAFLLTGCGIPLTSGAAVPDMSKVTIGAEPTDVASETASPAPKPVKGTCEPLSSGMLEYLESIGNAGGDIQFRRRAMIQVDETWWEAAVAVWVNPKRDDYVTPDVRYFRTNVPGDPAVDHGREIGYSAKASGCLQGN